MSSADRTRVMVVDDHSIMRSGLEVLAAGRVGGSGPGCGQGPDKNAGGSGERGLRVDTQGATARPSKGVGRADGTVTGDADAVRRWQVVRPDRRGEGQQHRDGPEHPLPHTGQAWYQDEAGAGGLGCAEWPGERRGSGLLTPRSTARGSNTSKGPDTKAHRAPNHISKTVRPTVRIGAREQGCARNHQHDSHPPPRLRNLHSTRPTRKGRAGNRPSNYGPMASGLGEVAHLTRVDHRQERCHQGACQGQFQDAGGLQTIADGPKHCNSDTRSPIPTGS